MRKEFGMKRSLLTWATTLAVVGAIALPVMAGGGGGGGGGGGRGGRGGAAGGGMGGGGMGGGGMGGGAMGGGAMGGGAMGGGAMGGGAMGGGRAAVTPEQQITTSMTNIQTQLGMTAGGNEWNVLSAKIQKVLQDQQKLAAGAQNPLGGGRGGRGGAAGGMGGGAAAAVDTTNPLAVARDDLSKAVMPPAGGGAAPTTGEPELKTKMTAVRTNRTKLEEQLKTDQADLQKVCTVRQEAILVVLGVLN
jgi:hypothetical protein